VKAVLYQIIGVIDGYGHCACLPIFKEANGELSQMYPGHYYIRNQMCHKRWRWLVKENRLDRSALMDWEPDAEEMDLIEQRVQERIKWYGAGRESKIPHYSTEGLYPNWRKVSEGRP
jgi:hypothetical protein